MSYIGESRKGLNRPWEMVLCLEESDCQLLLKAVQKIAIHSRKNYEKWKDIQDGGEMTTRQETALMKAEENMENADELYGNIKAFLVRVAKSEECINQIMKEAGNEN